MGKLIPFANIAALGRAGQTAAQVVARQGGIETKLRLLGDEIPASGPVPVIAAEHNIFFHSYPGGPTRFEGTLMGVHGVYESVLRNSLGTFTRSEPGLAVSVSPGSIFKNDLAEGLRSADMFLCVGENGVLWEEPEGIAETTMLAVKHLSAARPCYMVAGVMPDAKAIAGSASRARWDRLNELLRNAHGSEYLDLVSPPTTAELNEVGYSADARDREDMAAGVYPRGMFADTQHLNSLGQHVWALRVRDRYRERGWL